MNETWKNIVGYEGLYQASSTGRIKSLSRTEQCGKMIRKRNERILKPGTDKDGYLRVVLCKNGKLKNYLVHRLVLKTFVPFNEKEVVNHKDGKKQNNHISNLEWNSVLENTHHSILNNLSPIGEKHYKAKLSNDDVSQIKALLDEKILAIAEIARMFKVNPCTIHDIEKGRSWKSHVV